MRLGAIFIMFLMASGIASAAAFQFNPETPILLWQNYRGWIMGVIAFIFILFILYFVFTSRYVKGYFEERNRHYVREKLRKKLEELRFKQSAGISLSAG